MTLGDTSKPKDVGRIERLFIAASFAAIAIALMIWGGFKITLLVGLSAIALLVITIGIERLNRYLDRFDD